MDMKRRLLHYAQHGDLEHFREVVKEAEGQGTQVLWNSCFHSKSGDTLVHVASRHGQLNILKCLREKVGHVNFEVANLDGKRAIHEAAQMGHLQCLHYLLSLGVEVNCFKKADWTPLMLSCTKDDLEVVKNLVESGAYLYLKNKDGWTCFHLASRQGNLTIISYLLDVYPNAWDTVSNNGRTPLHTAALHGLIDVVCLLLKRAHYPADQKDSCGTTPLMDAVRMGRVDIVDLLIVKHGADVGAKDNLDRQAIHLAAQAGRYEALIHLVERWHIDCNVLAHSKITPLHLACKEGQYEVIETLVNLGANVNWRDDKGHTALDIATACKHVRCINLLSEHKNLTIADMAIDHQVTH